ncbi:presqualene diphosphate synthase HpnD [Acetobacter vaccinii]|uniref:Presqualene diphosphate synthase HpnD n=1 Tax=Acetobacter vaccinii TaxID=2592655 RepID=A0A5C1YPN6_9PROT|nr:presqualene diphosphate synthase HpnD [Acetobacter vaccinii]QEO17498.1 presqualene diphosphate synthase HpnD [Acetobacter vaccinii]
MTAQHIQTHDEPTPLGCDPADLAWVENTVRQAGTSFASGMRILPPMRRYGMYAIYAFCRVVDDIADGHDPLEERTRALQDWHARIAALYEGPQVAPKEPLERVLLAAIHFFALRQEDFAAVIDGMLMDTQTAIVAPDEKTLDTYCDRVASAVGRLSVRIFGECSDLGDKVAYHLGRALQLTNILRDIPEDATRGRLYLPSDLLDRFAVPHDPVRALTAPGLEGVCRILATRAQDHFRTAFTLMKSCRPKAMMPARIMGASYESILYAMLKRGWAPAVLRQRVRTKLPAKAARFVHSYLP